MKDLRLWVTASGPGGQDGGVWSEALDDRADNPADRRRNEDAQGDVSGAQSYDRHHPADAADPPGSAQSHVTERDRDHGRNDGEHRREQTENRNRAPRTDREGEQSHHQSGDRSSIALRLAGSTVDESLFGHNSP